MIKSIIVNVGGTALFTDEMAELNGINIAREDITLAEKYTLWSWYDITLAFHEVGHQVTDYEAERIKKALFLKKLKHIIGAKNDS